MSAQQNPPTTFKEKLHNLFRPTQLHQSHVPHSALILSKVQQEHAEQFFAADSPSVITSNASEGQSDSSNFKPAGSSAQPVTKEIIQPLIISDAAWVNLASAVPAETRIKTLRSLRQQIFLPPELLPVAPGKNSPHAVQQSAARRVKVPSETSIDALWSHCCDILLLPSSSFQLATVGDAGQPREKPVVAQSLSGLENGAMQLLHHEAKMAFLSLLNALLLLSKTYRHTLQPDAPSLVDNVSLKQMIVAGLHSSVETTELAVVAVATDNEYLTVVLETISILTDNGKQIDHVETTTPQFLLRWLLRIRKASALAGASAAGTSKNLPNAGYLPPITEHIRAILTMLSNIIRCQNAKLADNIADSSVDYVSQHLLYVTRKTSAVDAGIQLIDVVVSGSLKPEKLEQVVYFLCRTVNIAVEEVASQSWKTMRNILSTTLGMKTIQCVCDLLENKTKDLETTPLINLRTDNKDAMRGAVYFLGMALWGSKRVTSLQINASSVLPSIAAALRNQNDLALHYEVLLCLHRFLKKHGNEMDSQAYEQVVKMSQELVDSYYVAVAAIAGSVTHNMPAAASVSTGAAARRSTIVVAPLPTSPPPASDLPHVLVNPYRHELGQILSTLCDIYADKCRRNSSTEASLGSQQQQSTNSTLLSVLDNAIDILAPEQVATVVIADRVTVENFLDCDEVAAKSDDVDFAAKDVDAASSASTKARRTLFAHCVRRCLCDDREEVQLEVIKQLERVHQKLAVVGNEQQLSHFVDSCITLNFQNVAFVHASASSSASSMSHSIQTQALAITSSANVGTRKVKFLTQVADNLTGLNFAKLADLLVINLANCMAVAYQHHQQPIQQSSVSNLQVSITSLTSPASVPQLNSMLIGGGTSPALTASTPLSAFILPPATSSSFIASTSNISNNATTKPVYDACVMLLSDELLRLFARKMFADQVFEANYVYERLMALLQRMYSKNQLYGKLNSTCRRKVFRGLSSLSANKNGNICFEFYFDGGEKVAQHESSVLKAFMPPNADWGDDDDEDELKMLHTDDVSEEFTVPGTSAAGAAETGTNNLTLNNASLPEKLFSISRDAESQSGARGGRHTPTYSNQSSVVAVKAHRVQMLDVSMLLRNIVTCINRERDWDVLSVVLADLPLLLRNHPLLIAVVARAQNTTAVMGGSSVSSSPTISQTLQQQHHASLATLARQRRSAAAMTSKLTQPANNASARVGSVSVASTLMAKQDGLQTAPLVSANSSTATIAASGASKSESDDEPPHNLVEQLASALCQLCLDRVRSDPVGLYNVPAWLTRSGVHERVFQALACMASCAAFIGVETQQHIIKCLEQCLDSRNARLPLRALTLCLMQFAEMRMTKLLPSVLLSVKKISSSERNSTHMLEFLSNLVNLPHLYRNFVDEQFRSMFALALPYTNPYRFSNYAVALAYVTLASWFLRSRVLFRKEFVRFIVKGLKSNLLMNDNARQNMSRQSQALALEAASSEGSSGTTKVGESSAVSSSSGRKESSTGMSTSGEESPLRRRTQSVNAAQYQRMKAAAAAQSAAGQDSSSVAGSGTQRNTQASTGSGCELLASGASKFERGLLYELVETFVDLMERHAFGNVVPQPPKTPSPLDVFPPERLQSKTWLLGYRMVRITTLGPGSVTASTDSNATITAASGRMLSKQVLSLDVGNTGAQVSPLLSPRDHGRTLAAAFAHGEMRGTGSAASQHQSPSLHRRATLDMISVGTPTDSSNGNGRSSSIVPPSPAVVAVTKELPNSESGTDKSISPVDQHFFYADLDSHYSQNSRSSSKSRAIQEEGDEDDVATFETDSHAERKAPTTLRISCSDSALAASALSGGVTMSDSLLIVEGSPTSNNSTDSGNKLNFDAAGTLSTNGQQKLSSLQRYRHPTSPPSRQPQQPQLLPAWFLVEHQRQWNAAASVLDASSWVLIHVRTATGVTQWTMKMDNHTLFSLPSLLGVKHDVGNTDSAFGSAGAASSGGYPSLAWPLSGTHVGTADGMYNADGSSELGLTDAGSGSSAGHYIDPAFVFLHLFCTHLTGERPLLLPKSDAVERAVKVLDHIHPYETHKVGVIYCAPLQRPNDETVMLSNTSGSLRYMNFLAGLGELVALASVDPEVTYTGGLDCSASAEDGRYTYVWRTFLTQLVFHVTTLMPNRESDPKFTGKKLHIGNDFVNIIYNESKGGEDFRIQTLKGQFVMACVVVHPLALGVNSVRVLIRDDLRDVLPQWQASPAIGGSSAVVAQQAGGYYSQEDIVTDRFLPSFVRQTAMHLNLACRIFKEERKSAPSASGNEYPFVSNWFERLRQLKRIRHRLVQDNAVVAANGSKSTAAASESSGAPSSSAASKHVKYSAATSTSAGYSAAVGNDSRHRFDSYNEVDIDFTDFL